MAQWLGLHASNAGVAGSIPGWETRFHMSQVAKNFKNSNSYMRRLMPVPRKDFFPTKILLGVLGLA